MECLYYRRLLNPKINNQQGIFYANFQNPFCFYLSYLIVAAFFIAHLILQVLLFIVIVDPEIPICENKTDDC